MQLQSIRRHNKLPPSASLNNDATFCLHFQHPDVLLKIPLRVGYIIVITQV